MSKLLNSLIILATPKIVREQKQRADFKLAQAPPFSKENPAEGCAIISVGKCMGQYVLVKNRETGKLEQNIPFSIWDPL